MVRQNDCNQRLATVGFLSGPILSRVRCIALLCRVYDLRLTRPVYYEPDHEVEAEATCQRERQIEGMNSRIRILNFTQQGERITHRREHQHKTESQIPEPR